MIDADLSKAFVMEAIRRLVDDELAEWVRSKGDELVLRLVTGERFTLGDAGITCTQRGPGSWSGRSAGHTCSVCLPEKHRAWKKNRKGAAREFKSKARSGKALRRG